MILLKLKMATVDTDDDGCGGGGDYAKITKAPRLIALLAQNVQCASVP